MSKLIPIFIAILFAGAALRLEAASVTKVNKKKRVVTIDAGKDDGLSKGDKICIFGVGGDKIGCGKIRKVKAKSANIRFNKKKIKKIDVGMEATPADGAGGGGEGGGSSSSKLKFAYIFTPMMPFSYQKLTYYAPEGASADTLWAPAEKAKDSFLGFGAEFELGLSGGKGLTFGGRMKYLREFTSAADYDLADITKYAEVNQTATALGFWTDFYYLKAGIFRMGNGLDIDMSSQSFAAAYKTDDGDEDLLAEAKTKLTTISLRTVAGLDFFLDPVGIHLGLNFLLPLSGSKSGTAEVLDANAEKLTVDPNEDLLLALAHQKASFALEVFMAAYVAF